MIKNENKFIFLLLILTGSFIHLNAQDSSFRKNSTENLVIQLNKNKSIQYGRFGTDSIKLVLQVKEENATFPSTFFVKGKILGDSSGFILNVPTELMKQKNTWTISEYIATAST